MGPQQRSRREGGAGGSHWIGALATALLIAACGGGHGTGEDPAGEEPPPVAMTPVDVGGDAIRTFPGTFSGIDAGGTKRQIASYGTTEFSLTQGGRRLKLASGRTATPRRCA